MNAIKTFIFAIVFFMLTYLLIGLFVSFVANENYREVIQWDGYIVVVGMIVSFFTIGLSINYDDYLNK